MTLRFLSMTDVARRLGITTGALAGLRLPEPDVLVGRSRGWLPETIDEWNASRPGRGNAWSGKRKPYRPRKLKTQE